MTSGTASVRTTPIGEGTWGLQRAVAVGYGVLYDYIFARFEPYRALSAEVLRRVESSTAPSVPRRDVRILDIACGPGSLTLLLAEAGYTVLGIDPYASLIDLAREKRRAQHLTNVAFQQADLTDPDPRWSGTFDFVVNMHSLYAHPAPMEVLRQAYRVLKPGGHGVFVNFTQRVPLVTTFQRIWRRDGLVSALRCLLWVLPNAVFEATRKPVGPHYWREEELTRHLTDAGFAVQAMQRTFLDGVSLLAWTKKDSDPKGR